MTVSLSPEHVLSVKVSNLPMTLDRAPAARDASRVSVEIACILVPGVGGLRLSFQDGVRLVEVCCLEATTQIIKLHIYILFISAYLYCPRQATGAVTGCALRHTVSGRAAVDLHDPVDVVAISAAAVRRTWHLQNKKLTGEIQHMSGCPV